MAFLIRGVLSTVDRVTIQVTVPATPAREVPQAKTLILLSRPKEIPSYFVTKLSKK
jgi:hypothetical protein